MNSISQSLTDMEGLDNLKIGFDNCEKKQTGKCPDRIVSIYTDDWVYVPNEDMEYDLPDSPVKKQRSNCSSLDKTLSYVFAVQSRDYLNRRLENSLFPIGHGKNELARPHGLVYDKETERVFIADSGNNRIQIYPPFNTSALKERTRTLSQIFIPDPKMDKPWGICLSKEYIFVTQYYGHCVDVYTYQKNFITRFGSKGFGKGKFSCPTGICAIRDRIYICDSNNNCVQIFTRENKEYKFVKSFGIHHLTNPLDIKTYNTDIFVLDSSKRCLHKFDYNHKHLKNLITNGAKCEVDNPKFFDIDEDGNFLISDWLNHSVKVFNCDGVRTGVIGLSLLMCPKGITAGKFGEVFIVDEKGEQLKLF
ncbi:E3 ubiquitin-protein ligase TRIM71-like [Oopsacas minuta]|uniref:E3 ubiquitin-protein ligase TRIM71-like n=1 Tax=Oopsacas minuta TaxID=111878 RepID=A0AAV7KGV3_9METZ|nr:E3 ubiquitin-protein ligase TRIM71-like [Oopsacas minuta]